MNNRFQPRHESGSDYAVIDTARAGTPVVATGLSSDEAEETCKLRNEAEDAKADTTPANS